LILHADYLADGFFCFCFQTPSALSKLSLDLRLLTELVLAGVMGQDALNIIIASIRAIVTIDKDAQCIIPILVIVKAFGYELSGIVPTHIKQLCDTYTMSLPSCNLIPATKQLKMKTMLLEYMQTVAGVWMTVRNTDFLICSSYYFTGNIKSIPYISTYLYICSYMKKL